MLNRVLGGIGRVLIAIGVVILLFVAFQLWGTGLEQAGHQDDLGHDFSKKVLGSKNVKEDSDQAEDAIVKSLAKVDPQTAPPTGPGTEGEPLAVIEIPRIGVKQIVVEGVSKTDLKKGPGHYMKTPLPGQAGNAAIAGHRTTYGAPFNRIDELLPGDPIYVSTLQGRFRYEVMAPQAGAGLQRGAGWFSVKPTDVFVIDKTLDNRLTLTACHPKRSAAQRIVVQAKLAVEPAAAVPTTIPAGQSPNEFAAEQEELQKAEASLGGDASAKFPALAFGLAFAALWIAAWIIGRRWKMPWKKWLTYGVSTPAAAALLWFCFVFTDRWLPSI